MITEGSTEAKARQTIQEEIATAIDRGDFEETRNKTYDSFKVGTYKPWFAQYGPDGTIVRNITAQIEHDHGEFLDICEGVLTHLFD